MIFSILVLQMGQMFQQQSFPQMNYHNAKQRGGVRGAKGRLDENARDIGRYSAVHSVCYSVSVTWQ